MEYGNKLNPTRSLREARAITGPRQKVIVTHNPSEIDQNQLLLVRFLNLGSDNVIVPGTASTSFNIEMSWTTDPKRSLASNVDRVIVKKLAVKFKENEIMGVDDFNVFTCYKNLWKTESKKQNTMRQGIIHSGCSTKSCI